MQGTSNAEKLQSVISDDLFPQVQHISDVKQVLEEMTTKAQELQEWQIKAILLLESLSKNEYLHGKADPYREIINFIMQGKVLVADPQYYIDTIEALIPKPPKPVIVAPNGVEKGGETVVAHHFFIQGPLGAGKTLMMSLLAHHWREKVRARGGDIQLFSNYGLKDSIPLEHYTDWYKVAEAQGSICCWDEAQMAFSNRKWSKYGATIATEVMMFTRKMKSVQIYCSPSINNVDSRIRQIVEVLINVRKIGDRGFAIHFTDYQTGEFMHKQFLPMWKAKKIFKLGLYDTDTMVLGFPLPSTEREGNEFFETLEEIHDKARKTVRRAAHELLTSAGAI